MSAMVIQKTMGVFIAFFLSGCAAPSLTQIGALSKGASLLAEDSKKALELINSSAIDRKMYDVAADSAQSPTDATFEGLFKEPFSTAYRIRVALLEKLSSYAKALENLATADFRKDVDAASAELFGSISCLCSSYKKATSQEIPFTDDHLKIIAAGIEAIGNAIVEVKRRRAIKTIVIQTDTVVQKVVKLLENDFGKDSDFSQLVQQNLLNAQGSLGQAYNAQRTTQHSTFDSRYAMLVKIRRMHDAAKTSPQLFENISAGSKKVGEAHAALRIAVTKNKFSSAELSAKIGEIVEYVKFIDSFYEKIGSRN